MIFVRTFPRLLAVCLSIVSVSAVAAAQDALRPRQAAGQTQATTTATEANGRARLETDVVLISESDAEMPAEEMKAPSSFDGLGVVESAMLAAIEGRLGVPYRLGTEGPTRFDCSGFVWSVFREAGFGFERTTARNLWSQFVPAGDDEKFKFGTLVFFNQLGHVGIVADENGFYHASTSKGVVYSRFDDYWTKRITGFRRAPAAHALIASAGR